jgi:hypothetical protein
MLAISFHADYQKLVVHHEHPQEGGTGERPG